MTDSRLAGMLFAAAFLARLVAAMGSAIFCTDGGHYLLMADWMREGRFHDALLLTYHPLYPLLIGAVRSVTSSTEQAGELVSVALGAGAILPLFATVKVVFGRPAAFVTSLLYAFGPALVEVQSDVMTEGTYFFFFFSALWLTLLMAEEPSWVRGVVLGAAASGAFLTRPEGLLPIALSLAWPALYFFRQRKGLFQRASGILATAITILLLLSPYLLWVKAQRGHWALSARPAAISGEKSVGIGGEGEGEGTGDTQGVYYRLYGRALFRLSGILIPFFLLGLGSLPNLDLYRGLLYFSFPLGQMAGVLLTLRRHNFMTERYILAGMSLMMAIAALGLLKAVAWLSRRPGRPGRPAMGAALVLFFAVLPGLRCLKLRRQECLSYPAAARWIQSQPGPRPRGMAGPVEQVAYLSGCRSYYTSKVSESFKAELKSLSIDYVVYSENHVHGRPDYIAMVRSCDALEPAVSVSGPPGTRTVYIQRVK